MNAPDPSSNGSINLRSAAATVVAGILGAIAGAIAATRIPGDKFAWTGFALVPLLALLELLLRYLVRLFAGDVQATRFTLAGAIVVAFYASWFSLRAA
jgi:uncharacterized membrane protein YfcA